MNKRPQGLSLREYARRCGCAPSYIHKLLTRGAIPRNRDGTIDARVADACRALNTIMRGGDEGPSLPSGSSRTCVGCGDDYRWAPESPDADKYCTMECCEAVAAGMTTKEIRQKIARESRE